MLLLSCPVMVVCATHNAVDNSVSDVLRALPVLSAAVLAMVALVALRGTDGAAVSVVVRKTENSQESSRKGVRSCAELRRLHQI